MDHGVDQVAVRDGLGRPAHEVEVLDLGLDAARARRARKLALDVVLLHEERHDAEVVEVHLDLVGERQARHGREGLRAEQLVEQGPRRLERVLLVHADAVREGEPVGASARPVWEEGCERGGEDGRRTAPCPGRS